MKHIVIQLMGNARAQMVGEVLSVLSLALVVGMVIGVARDVNARMGQLVTILKGRVFVLQDGSVATVIGSVTLDSSARIVVIGVGKWSVNMQKNP